MIKRRDRPLAAIDRGWSRLVDLSLVCAGFIYMVIAVIITYSTVTRKAGNPANWPDEVSTYLLLWGVFLAAGGTYFHGGHVAVDTVVIRLPLPVQHVLAIVCDAVVALLAVILVHASWKEVTAAYESGRTSLTLVDFPIWPVTFGMVVGGALLVLAALMSAVSRLREGPTERRRIDTSGGVG